MFEDFTVPTRPMTADDVLAVLEDDYRQSAQIPPGVDPRVSVAFSTTVHRWFYARFDLMPYRRLGNSFNYRFKTSFTEDQWRGVLYPPKDRTLRDVCDLIATAARKPVIEPVTILGQPCADAAAFLAIRKMLADGGADVTGLLPSSPVEPYLQRWSKIFFDDIAGLAPGRLPTYEAIPKVKYGWIIGRTLRVAWLVGTLGMLVAMTFGPGHSWAVAAACGGFGTMGLCILIVILSGPPHQRFGTVRTFRDLSKAMAAGAA